MHCCRYCHLLRRKMRKFILFALLCSARVAGAASITALEHNKQVVKEFYQAAINEKNYAKAQYYLGKNYIQHNPLAADGKAGLEKFIASLKQTYPLAHSEIKRVIAEKNYVVLHVKSVVEPGKNAQAVIDIFRLAKGKIVEHWDVHQAVAEKTMNKNTMF